MIWAISSWTTFDLPQDDRGSAQFLGESLNGTIDGFTDLFGEEETFSGY